eukprot:scaffold81399_cov24-Phaeocystis_antarctica.AAC.1
MVDEPVLQPQRLHKEVRVLPRLLHRTRLEISRQLAQPLGEPVADGRRSLRRRRGAAREGGVLTTLLLGQRL